MNTNHLVKTIYVACLAGLLLVGGCSQGGGPNPQIQAQNVEKAKTLRSYFDKVGGDYSQLSAADKEAFIKASGGQEKAEQNWNLMKNGPSAGRPESPQQ